MKWIAAIDLNQIDGFETPPEHVFSPEKMHLNDFVLPQSSVYVKLKNKTWNVNIEGVVIENTKQR